MGSFDVVAYSRQAFETILREKADKPVDFSDKAHVHYFEQYFAAIGVKCILVEDPYVDRDYLEDYADYYARCFSDYRRKCARLHFFTEMVDAAALDQALKAKAPETLDLQPIYAGFMVVKPLPKRVIGRTCLRNYPGGDGRQRVFPINQRYDVNLFGIPLSIESLPFQEQDNEVAACATTALWSAFQATGRRFQHVIPSPVEITRAASSAIRTSNRAFPNNDGLNILQMADAIRSVGLEPHAVTVGRKNSDVSPELFKSIAYAYLKGRIPCLAAGQLVNVATNKPFEALHAITLNGFSMGATAPVPKDGGPRLMAMGLDRIYGHDDAVGPYSRLRFDPADNGRIMTSWRDREGQWNNVAFVPLTLLMPVYHKIRVPFASVHAVIKRIDVFLKRYGSRLLRRRAVGNMQWDIYLSTSGDVKAAVMGLPNTDLDYPFLTASLPKYVWVADLYDGEAILLKALFDATDLVQGGHFLTALCHDPDFGRACAIIWRNRPADVYEGATKLLLDWFEKSFPAAPKTPPA